MSDLTAFVRPAYENLLCSFAMVTQSEFPTYLDNIDATLALMERTVHLIQLGGKAELVSKWALSVMRKYVFDNSKDGVFETGRTEISTLIQGLDMLTGSNVVVSDDFEAGD
jgi:hypothetical protein